MELRNKQLPLWLRVSGIAFSIAMLGVIYIFQRVNFSAVFFRPWTDGVTYPYVDFIFNKTFRLVLNDFCCFLMIWFLFTERKYLRVAFVVFLFELLFLLPVYFILKLSIEGDSEISSPLLSQFHRLIVNPTLMVLLIMAFYYQQFTAKR